MEEENKNGLKQTFDFDNFHDASQFATKVAKIADRRNHHPKIIIENSSVTIISATRSVGDQVTKYDHDLLAEIRDLVRKEEEIDGSTKINDVKLFTDGGSRGNPGPSAIGFAILDLNDQLIKKESKYLGITTNNQAEYQGLKQGLEMCQKMGFGKVDVYMDSLLVVNQMKGIYKVKNRDLWPIYDSVREFLSNFKEVNFTHVPREMNKLADSMVNECLDDQTD